MLEFEVEILDIGGHINVVDYKTVEPRSEKQGLTKSSNGHYFRQLFFYKMFLENHKTEWFVMTSGTIDFVGPTKSGTYRRYIFEITDDDVEKVSAEIKNVMQKILDLSFWNEYCGDKNCLYCTFRKLFIKNQYPRLLKLGRHY